VNTTRKTSGPAGPAEDRTLAGWARVIERSGQQSRQFERNHAAIHDAAPGTCQVCDAIRAEKLAAAGRIDKLAAASDAARKAFDDQTPESLAAWQEADAAYRAAYAQKEGQP
jgi:hypothetical protein